MTSGIRGEEPPPTYSFAVALTIFAAIMWFFALWVLIGVPDTGAVIVLIFQVLCLVGLGFAAKHLIGKKKFALITVPVAVFALWFVTLIEGAVVWGDVIFFVGQLTDEPLYGAQLAALILSLAVVVLVFLPKTRSVLTVGTLVPGIRPADAPPEPAGQSEPEDTATNQWAQPPAPYPPFGPQGSRPQGHQPPAPQPRPPFGPQGNGPQQH